MNKISKTIIYISCLLISLSLFSLAVSAANDAADPMRVTSYEELASALGEENVLIEKEYLVIRNDIVINAPIEFAENKFVIYGAGCRISTSYTDNSFFILSDGAELVLGNIEASSTQDTLIFDGEGKTYKGAVFSVNNECILMINKGTAIINALNSENGGAAANNGVLFMNAGRVENCRSEKSGGAFHNTGEMHLVSGEISSCSAETGGVVFNSGKLFLAGTEISNAVAAMGGAVYNVGELVMLSSTVTSSTAQNGGAVYNAGTAQLSGGQITDCSSSVGGGGIYNDGTLELNGTYVSKNSSANGGNIYNVKIVKVSGSTVTYGKATGFGGNIYNSDSGELELVKGTVTWGKAEYGGGLYNLGTTQNGACHFIGNSATVGGGALNCGKMYLLPTTYYKEPNDIAVLINDTADHSLIIDNPLNAQLAAMITPCVSANGGYGIVYENGMVLLSGNAVAESVEKLQLTAKDGTKWLILNDGSVSEKLPVYYSAWFYVTVIFMFIVTASLMLTAIRFFERVNKSKNDNSH